MGDPYGRDAPPSSAGSGGVTVNNLRCRQCNKLLAEQITAPWKVKCVRCGAMNFKKEDDATRKVSSPMPSRYRPSRSR